VDRRTISLEGRRELQTKHSLGRFFVWKPTEEAPSGGEGVGDLIARLLTASESIFSDINFLKLKRVSRVSNWRVVDADGQSYRTDIDIGYDPNFGRVNQYCTTLLQQIFRGPSHEACGCTMPKAPWRAVVIERPDAKHGCNQSVDFLVAHELWHLKGYWTHTPDGQWPADVKTGRVAPRRIPRADD
jgi:hypothetical protein